MFLSSEQDYLLVEFFQTFGLFLGTVSKQMFLLADTPQKVDKFHRKICLTYSCISSVQTFVFECSREGHLF